VITFIVTSVWGGIMVLPDNVVYIAGLGVRGAAQQK
jgi:hypothetical protein